MIDHFDVKYLSPNGFRVLVTDTNVTLPTGELVESGMHFRNSFHLHSLFTADLFVPCGGRPQSIHINNVNQMYDSEGKPKFKVHFFLYSFLPFYSHNFFLFQFLCLLFAIFLNKLFVIIISFFFSYLIDNRYLISIFFIENKDKYSILFILLLGYCRRSKLIFHSRCSLRIREGRSSVIQRFLC